MFVYNITDIKIRPMKQVSGLRNRNKFPCNYCPKLVFEYARHLKICHPKKRAVAAILLKPKNNRKHDFDRLRSLAIRQHNMDVLDSCKGELIVGRRSSRRQEAEDYLPCPQCNMMYSPNQLWRHYKHCRQRLSAVKEKSYGKRFSVVRQAKVVMEFGLTSHKACEDFTADVLSTVRRDSVSRVAKRDVLIVMYGQSRYKRIGRYRSTEVAQGMRLLARLLISVQGITNSSITLNECVSGQHFDHVLTAVESLCDARTDDTGRNIFDKPSLGTKIGHALVKCAQLKKREAIKDGSKRLKAEAEAFLALHESDWSDTISARAIMSLKMKRLQGPESLPQTDDLVKLKEHIDERIRRSVGLLKQRFSYSVYRDLLEYTLAALILFNKRRGGEASKLLLTAYTGRRDWNHSSNKEILASLTEVEKTLVKRYEAKFNFYNTKIWFTFILCSFIVRWLDAIKKVINCSQ